MACDIRLTRLLDVPESALSVGGHANFFRLRKCFADLYRDITFPFRYLWKAGSYTLQEGLRFKAVQPGEAPPGQPSVPAKLPRRIAYGALDSKAIDTQANIRQNSNRYSIGGGAETASFRCIHISTEC